MAKVYSHGVFLAPLLGEIVEFGPVRLVDPSYLGYQRVFRVGVSQQGTDGE